MNQNSLFLILAAPACAWVAGMGLFKTLLVLVVMHRWVPHGQFTGPMADFLGSDITLYVVSVVAVIEVIVDLVPRLDIQWDRWNAWLRILGAVVLTWFILHNEDSFSRVIMCAVAVALSITSLTAKTSARRAAIKGRTAVIVAPVASVTEDCMVAATLLPLTQLPPMTLLMVAFMAMASMLIMYVIRKETRETLRWVFGFQWIPAVPEPKTDSELSA